MDKSGIYIASPEAGMKHVSRGDQQITFAQILSDNGIGIMTIRKASLVFYLTTVTLIILLIVLIVLRFFELQRSSNAYQVRYASYLLADELRQSSDDLTRMARSYVATGNPRFKQMYMSILAIRDGEKERPEHYERSYWDLVDADSGFRPKGGEKVALSSRMSELGLSPHEIAKLAEAESSSNDLLDTRTRTAVVEAERRSTLYVSGIFVSLTLLMGWLIFSYWVVRRKVQNLVRLENETRNIGKAGSKPRFRTDSADEIGSLSRAFILTQKERDRYFDQSLNFLAISDFSGRFKRVNAAWAAILGYPSGELLGRAFIDFVTSVSRRHVAAELDKLSGGEPVSFECQMCCKDNSLRWVMLLLQQTSRSSTFPVRTSRCEKMSR